MLTDAYGVLQICAQHLFSVNGGKKTHRQPYADGSAEPMTGLPGESNSQPKGYEFINYCLMLVDQIRSPEDIQIEPLAEGRLIQLQRPPFSRSRHQIRSLLNVC